MKLFNALILCWITISSTHSQVIDTPFVHYTIESKAFGEERKITVYLPINYIENPTDSLMVTYLLDAQAPQFFRMMASGLDYLASRSSIIPTLIVGIHAKNRFTEFTPAGHETVNGKQANAGSQLATFQQHLQDEVFPLIESKYPVKPFRAIIGHSRGGSYVFETLFNGWQDLFDAYIAISPALGFNNEQTIRDLEKTVASGIHLPKFLFQSAGDQTEQEKFFLQEVEQVDSILKSHPTGNLLYHKHLFPGKDHFSTVLPALSSAMVTLKNEFMPSFENIDRFVQNQQIPFQEQLHTFQRDRLEKYGFFHIPSERYFRVAAERYFESENYQAALPIYEYAYERQPFTRWWEVFNMGTCYHHLGKEEQAEECFQKTLELMENYREQYGDRFDEIKSDVVEQMEEIRKK